MSLNVVGRVFAPLLSPSSASTFSHYLFNISRGFLKIVANWLTFTNQICARWKDKHFSRRGSTHILQALNAVWEMSAGFIWRLWICPRSRDSIESVSVGRALVRSFFFSSFFYERSGFWRMIPQVKDIFPSHSLPRNVIHSERIIHGKREMKSISRRFLCDLLLFCGFVLCSSKVQGELFVRLGLGGKGESGRGTRHVKPRGKSSSVSSQDVVSEHKEEAWSHHQHQRLWTLWLGIKRLGSSLSEGFFWISDFQSFPSMRTDFPFLHLTGPWWSLPPALAQNKLFLFLCAKFFSSRKPGIVFKVINFPSKVKTKKPRKVKANQSRRRSKVPSSLSTSQHPPLSDLVSPIISEQTRLVVEVV